MKRILREQYTLRCLHLHDHHEEKMNQSNELKRYPQIPGKIWKTSITKEELSGLPAEVYSGTIHLIDKEEDIAEAVNVLCSQSVIGFDTETKPSFRRGERNTVSLLQLSTATDTYLFRLNRVGLPAGVCEILEDENILKIGVSIHDDFLNLHKKFKLNPKGFVDLQTYVKNFNIADNSLSRIYGILFDKRISKGQRLSNWEAPSLTQHQQEYAALDALACVNIYNHLLTHGFDYRTSKYYREFEDPNFQHEHLGQN